MEYFRKHHYFHAFFIYLLLVAIPSVTICAPCPAAQVNPQFVALAFKVEAIVRKIKKLKKSPDSKKALDIMLELKNDIQFATGKYIDMDVYLNAVFDEMKYNNVGLTKKDIATVRKAIEKKVNRKSHREEWMAKCIEENTPFLELEEDYEYASKHKGQEEANLDDMPVRVTVGVIIALCGLFIMFIPDLGCKLYGGEIMTFGIALATEGVCDRVQEDKDKEKKS